MLSKEAPPREKVCTKHSRVSCIKRGVDIGVASMQEKGDMLLEKWKSERKLDHVVMQLNNVEKRTLKNSNFFHY